MVAGKRRGGGRRRGGMKKGKRVGRKNWRSKRNTNNIGGPNTCKVTETYDLGDLQLNAGYLVSKAGITPGFRAASVAPNFGLYRVAKLEFTIRPYFDTFLPIYAQAGGGQVGNMPNTAPYMYWKINRYGDAPAAITGAYLREQGSKPIRLDEKIVKIAYRPNVLLADVGAVAAAEAGGSGQLKMTPWLSTDNRVGDNAFNLSDTKHYGHMMFFEGPASGDAQPKIARFELKVVYEFKNPRSVASTSEQVTAPSVALAV